MLIYLWILKVHMVFLVLRAKNIEQFLFCLSQTEFLTVWNMCSWSSMNRTSTCRSGGEQQLLGLSVKSLLRVFRKSSDSFSHHYLRNINVYKHVYLFRELLCLRPQLDILICYVLYRMHLWMLHFVWYAHSTCLSSSYCR